jgi:hypothetical protein
MSSQLVLWIVVRMETVGAMAAELFDFGGEAPGNGTQGPRLKRSNRPFVLVIVCGFPNNLSFPILSVVLLDPIFLSGLLFP